MPNDDVTNTHDYRIFKDYSKYRTLKKTKKSLSEKTFFLHLQHFPEINSPQHFKIKCSIKILQVNEPFWP